MDLRRSFRLGPGLHEASSSSKSLCRVQDMPPHCHTSKYLWQESGEFEESPGKRHCSKGQAKV